MERKQERYYGEFGGQYVSESLMNTLDELDKAYEEAIHDEEFLKQYHYYLKQYVGRENPLYYAEKLSKAYGTKIYLKREDLNHTGAHKINNVIGQILLAKRMGKTKVIAETGAGQHGVATATGAALFGMECTVYMGAEDIRRQELNVFRMEMLGAKVVSVTSGSNTLKDATNEAIRTWAKTAEDTFYIIGSAVGPYPYPKMVREFQSVISREAKKQFPDMYYITDVCMCEYTSHGHCGVLCGHDVDNDATLELLAKTAVSHIEAGADMVAPSDMMDGRVRAIREALDANGHYEAPIMSYAVKYASAFYGPFRDAAGSAPSFGDRKSYQMDFHNRREGMKEALTDVEEGADIIMVKPAMSYLDMVSEVSKAVNVPVAAYSVSGEYAMVKAAAKMDWIDEERIMCEMAVSAYRAGAQIYLTYYAKELAKCMDEGRIG